MLSSIYITIGIICAINIGYREIRFKHKRELLQFKDFIDKKKIRGNKKEKNEIGSQQKQINKIQLENGEENEELGNEK